MMDMLAQLSFGAPWILAALAGLPVLWWLLRVTPPKPRRIFFPPLRLLLGLQDEQQTPAHTPWWLLLLRLIAAGLLIAALADPLLGRAPKLAGNGPVVLVIDNGWSAAKGWDQRQSVIADLLRGAGDRPVALMPTATPPNQNNASVTLLDAGEAARRAGDLAPQPWPGDRTAVAAALARAHFTTAPQIFWLSDGLEDGHARALHDALEKLGPLTVLAPEGVNLPAGLLPPLRDGSGFTVTALRADNHGLKEARVAAIGSHGETLSDALVAFKPGENRAKAHITMPLEVRNQTARLEIVGEDSAGAVQLLDSGGLERRVGIVSARAAENEQPLLSDVYYLERALAPFAEAQKGTIGALIARHVSVLFLADVGKIGGTDADQVEKFVKNGGLLVRFAGPRMSNGADALVPVALRSGGRYLDSAMAWGQPQHLAPFGATSPFNGLAIPEEVTVARQILAEPSAELSNRAWARLTDGTPLVTARQEGQGWIVLFHITASPNWSTLPLSGLYVDMLKRLLALSAGTPAGQLASLSSLAPISLLDGYGHLRPPAADILPIGVKDFAKTEISAKHPPGLYGARGVENALNELGPNDLLLPLGGAGGDAQNYGAAKVLALQPYLLAAGAVLLLLDALLALLMRGYLGFGRRAAAAGLIGLLLIPPGAHAADESLSMKAALDTRLAYVITGIPDVDATSKAGLTGLGYVLKSRTSYEPEDPIGVDPERDDLSFFPLLYWPMDPREKKPSPAAMTRINDYMRLGGTILFDTRDLTLGPVTGANSPGNQTLRRLTQGLDLPPLQQVPADHVLRKAFYILRDFPGRWQGSEVWVEALPPPQPGDPAPARGGDGVSPVIIGGNDWAAAWAVDAQGHPLFEPVPGGENQREMAYRFGVNLVIYALTGNYKTDQVHAPALLQRMGR